MLELREYLDLLEQAEAVCSEISRIDIDACGNGSRPFLAGRIAAQADAAMSAVMVLRTSINVHAPAIVKR